MIGDFASGGRMELSISDRSGKIQNFYAFAEDIVTEMQEAMLETALDTQAIAYELCAFDTGFMRDHIEVITSPNLQTFEVGWIASEFFAAGFDFYAAYVVLGTRHMAPRDPLSPAFEQTKPMYTSRLADAARRAIERRRIS